MPISRRRLTAADDPSVTVVPARPGPMHWVLVILGMALAGWLYVWLAGVLVATTNQNPLAQDQKNNMRLALKVRPTLSPDASGGMGPAVMRWLPHRTDGVVAPLWPWVAAWTAHDGHSIDQETFADHSPADLAFFERGKWLNVWISGIFLMGLGWWVARQWTVLATLNFLLLAMLGALLPRAVAFQPEPVYFILFFLCWVAGTSLFARNPLAGYVGFGLLCGLAGLAKGSIQPLMAAWFLVMAVRFVIALWAPAERWSPARHALGVVLTAAVFLLVMAPRIVYGQERWGRPFFSYPNVWMWMDDFPTGFAWMVAHPDAAALDAVPREEWPSLATYRATHPPEQMVARLRDGLFGDGGSVRTFIAPKGSGRNAGTPEKPWKRLLEPRGWFLVAAAALTATAAALGWAGRRRGPVLPAPPTRWPEAWCHALFATGAVIGFALLYAWYSPIGRGDRFMLSLWMPIAFSLMAAAESSIRPLGWGPHRWAYTALHVALLGALLWRVSNLIRGPFFEMKLM